MNFFSLSELSTFTMVLLMTVLQLSVQYLPHLPLTIALNNTILPDFSHEKSIMSWKPVCGSCIGCCLAFVKSRR
ncbi:hypothetical protein B0H21DRAFT_739511 [Amylocystis lapponica]|nr:hypothetical protein B0H21DRAFT_739511 [Amylocystis lapponica]